MSRLTIDTPSRADLVMEQLYKDLERRIESSPPGLCPVDLSRAFLELCHAQTCGKCVPCRVGLGQLNHLIRKVLNGNATMETLDTMEQTAKSIMESADCAIGYEAAHMVYKGLIGYRDDYIEHIKNGRCTCTYNQPVPCVSLCPAHVDIPGYVALVGEGRYADAIRLIRKDNPFPTTCGFICEHPCEARCRRNMIDDSINIRGLKRVAADFAGEVEPPKCAPGTGKKIAVLGGGPGGLSAAYYLQLMGHQTTVYEMLPKLGGMLRYGIPNYRLPKDRLDEDINAILKTGVEVKYGLKIGEDITIQQLQEEYDAVLITIGASTDKKLGLEGEGAEGIFSAVQFLRNVGKNIIMDLTGKEVAVIGGGNVTMDAVRTAKRLGAEEIHLACLEARDAMTADEEEITQAQEEGIFVHPAQTFERITGTDAVTGVDFMNVKSFTFDENRRAIIEKEEGSEHHIDADTVIFAVGQRPDITEEAGLELGRGNSIVVKNMDNDKTTSVEGIFAAGDAIYGTKSVIMAIESGRQAASQIDKYLGGDGDISEVLAPVQKADPYIGQCPGFGYQERKHTQVDAPEKRSGNFNLFDHGICDSDICAEAGRCLQCDLRLQISRPSLWGDFVEQKEAE